MANANYTGVSELLVEDTRIANNSILSEIHIVDPFAIDLQVRECTFSTSASN